MSNNPADTAKDSITGVAGWETPAEQQVLKLFAEQVEAYGSIVEIGSEFGMSTSILAKFSDPSVHVSAVDPFPNDTFAQHSRNMARIGVLDRIVYFKMLSEAAAKQYLQNDGQLIDVLFIDGDHSTDAVLIDILMWLPMVEVGGVVIFHDTMAPTNMRPHEQHEWVEKAINIWRSGDVLANSKIAATISNSSVILRSVDPRKFRECPPVDSMRIFVRFKE